MQLSDVSSPRNVATIIYVLLSHIALALCLPVDQHESLPREIEARAPRSAQPPTKRDISGSAVGAIGGGAFALVLVALIIGLGSASIAIRGSLEWGEFRDRKKQPEEAGAGDEKGQKGSKEPQDEETGAAGVHPTRSNSSASTAQQTVAQAEEKTEVRPPPRSRLTLKSFLPPMDFHPTWLNNSNKG